MSTVSRLRLASFVLAAPMLCLGQVITTVAGTGTEAYAGDGGQATQALLAQPNGIAVDSAGNFYFADTRNIRVRKVTSAGIISTVAGDGTNKLIALGSIGDGGPATSAGFNPISLFQGLAVDAAGNLYISDSGNKRVRKVDTRGIITTFAGGGTGGDGANAAAAALGLPNGIALDSAGNLYVADTQAGKVRKVNTSGIISTVAGSGSATSSGDGGPATQAGLGSPMNVAVDNQGNLYIAEEATFHVRKVNTSGIISTVAGAGVGFSGDNGPATSANFGELRGLAVDQAGNLYIADYANNRVRKVDPSGIVTTVVGTGAAGAFGNNGDGGLPANAALSPSGLALDASGNLYISDYIAARIRKVTFGGAAPGLSVSVSAMSFASTTTSAPASQILKVSSAGPPLRFSVVATSDSANGPWLTLSTATGTTPQEMSVSVSGGLAPGTYQGKITVTPTTPGYTPVTVTVTVTISATVPPRPVITSLVNGASFESGAVPNSIWTIKGTNLASSTNTWDKLIVGGRLPVLLDGVFVTFSGRPAYVSYVSPTQINVLTPDTLPGSELVIVNNNGSSSAAFPAFPASYGPAFFSWPGNQVVATRQDYSYAVKAGTFAAPTVAAKPGDVLILWGTGFGATTPATLAGVVVPSDQTYSTSTPPTVTINNLPATVYGAALASGYAGLYQVAIQVPATLGNGDWPIVAAIGGVQSASGLVLAVQK